MKNGQHSACRPFVSYVSPSKYHSDGIKSRPRRPALLQSATTLTGSATATTAVATGTGPATALNQRAATIRNRAAICTLLLTSLGNAVARVAVEDIRTAITQVGATLAVTAGVGSTRACATLVRNLSTTLFAGTTSTARQRTTATVRNRPAGCTLSFARRRVALIDDADIVDTTLSTLSTSSTLDSTTATISHGSTVGVLSDTGNRSTRRSTQARAANTTFGTHSAFTTRCDQPRATITRRTATLLADLRSDHLLARFWRANIRATLVAETRLSVDFTIAAVEGFTAAVGKTSALGTSFCTRPLYAGRFATDIALTAAATRGIASTLTTGRKHTTTAIRQDSTFGPFGGTAGLSTATATLVFTSTTAELTIFNTSTAL